MVLLIGLHAAGAVPAHIIYNFEHRQGLRLLCAAHRLDHGAQRARPPDSCAAMDNEHLLVLYHMHCVVHQVFEQVLALFAQGFAHVAPPSPLTTIGFT